MHIPDKHISDQITAIIDGASRKFMAAVTPDDVITENYSRHGQLVAISHLVGDKPRFNRELSMAFDELESLHNLALRRITQGIATAVELEFITDSEICSKCDGHGVTKINTGSLAPSPGLPLPVADRETPIFTGYFPL